MTNLTDWLTQARDRADAATEGPWAHEPYGQQNQNGDYSGGSVFDDRGDYVVADVADVNGELIAAARTDLPAALDAIQAVLDLHQATDALMNPGRQERVVKVCTGCGADDGNWQRSPCPTARAIAAALGVSEP